MARAWDRSTSDTSSPGPSDSDRAPGSGAAARAARPVSPRRCARRSRTSGARREVRSGSNLEDDEARRCAREAGTGRAAPAGAYAKSSNRPQSLPTRLLAIRRARAAQVRKQSRAATTIWHVPPDRGVTGTPLARTGIGARAQRASPSTIVAAKSKPGESRGRRATGLPRDHRHARRAASDRFPSGGIRAGGLSFIQCSAASSEDRAIHRSRQACRLC